MPVRLRRRALGAALALALLAGLALALVDLNERHEASQRASARLALTRVATLQDSFTVAKADGPAAGTGGTLRRYRVEVERGVEVDAQAAADQVQRILADRRSWTADGQDSFQLVSAEPFDFTVRIASPQLVDRICGAAGLDTKGEVNCDVERQVMVNAKRWQTGSPQFTGSLDDYRALIVNHEVGHRIGHGHEGCPGPGQPAPAMMQQIYGLNGCLPNAWPYSADGHYLSGPPVKP
ncbi:DUF3152 domain-containing protein [Kitasatospora sp. MMS16-BH015]|uniref:DUF3152 domain-containing protein n=1 Tax=Kitasatospora sp. MMS16-BH015 TaxID=2018025 RepID=UPI0020C26257|nr:DUF3152 domain-containing protein [Kitasatospora sp. MMS16-BH015]